jgi:hypothetical protein
MNLDCIGSISWWKAWLDSGERVLHLNHTFQKQCSLSQYSITGPNKTLQLSVPTVKSTRKGFYKDVEINYSEDWMVNHWRGIESSYRKSPFYIYYNFRLEELFQTKEKKLMDFNLKAFDLIRKMLKIGDDYRLDFESESYYSEVPKMELKVYPQVFDDRQGFVPHLSILDLIFNLGPEAKDYLAISSSTSA